MKLSKENEEFIDRFIMENLRFMPSCNTDAAFLPFAINRPFTVYDISEITEEQGERLYELVPTALADCLPSGHLLYAVDWCHNTVLYDPRNAAVMQSREPALPQYNSQGIAYFHGFYPDGDYYFFIEKYGRFGYLSHPWRQEVWVYGEELLEEFDRIADQIGFISKATVK